jgi:hypothetical protein
MKLETKRLLNYLDACADGSIESLPLKVGKLGWRGYRVKIAGDASFAIYYGYAPRRTIVLDFNAMRLGDVEWTALKCQVHQVLVEGWPSLIARGHFTLAELACDFPGLDFQDYYFFDFQAHSSINGFISKGTSYLGSRMSGRQCKCYDKAKELNAKGASYEGSLLRLEACLHPEIMPVVQLASIRNPFLPLAPLRRTVVHDAATYPLRELRVAVRSMHKPPQIAFNEVVRRGSIVRKNLIHQMRQLAEPWWKPEYMWSTVPAVLGRFVEGATSLVYA